jgi:hypothetical protein
MYGEVYDPMGRVEPEAPTAGWVIWGWVALGVFTVVIIVTGGW